MLYTGKFTVNYHRHGEREWQINIARKIFLTKEVHILTPIHSKFLKGKAVFHGFGTLHYTKTQSVIE